MQRLYHDYAGGRSAAPAAQEEQQPLIIENVEILERDHRLERQNGHRFRRSDSLRGVSQAAIRQTASFGPQSQPPSRSMAPNYGAQKYSQALSPRQQGETTMNSFTPYHQQSRHANGSSTYQTQLIPPPPYPYSSRSSKRARSVVSEPALPEVRPHVGGHVATLSMDDIEQAFQVALNDQQPDYYQVDPPPWSNEGNGRQGGHVGEVYMHPLKRDSPPRQNRNYGSIQLASASSNAWSAVHSPLNRAPSPLPGMAPSGRRKSHRRVRSDSPARQVSSRTNTEAHPQQHLQKSLERSSLQRRRSFDAGPGTIKSPLKPQTRKLFIPSPLQSPQHRRRPSFQSSHGGSVRSDISLMSYRSDIRKSTYFEDYDSHTGKARLNYANSHVHLVMDETRSLVYGNVYTVPVHSNVYEQYYAGLQDQEDGSLGFDYDVGNLNFCGCDCVHCATCRGKTELSPRFYAICVRDDLYRRMVDEVCLSRSMPCGLFFCGYFEGAGRPSIFIAVALIGTLLVLMFLAACFVAG